MVGVRTAMALAPLAIVVACGGEPEKASSPTSAPVRSTGAATVAAVATVAVTRDPYAVPTASPGAGVRQTITVTIAPTTAPPTPTTAVAATAVATSAPASPTVPVPTPSVIPVTPTAVVANPNSAASGAIVFKIAPDKSSATFRVTEQLAGRDLPNDAVGTSRSVSGQLAFLATGALDLTQSQIVVDLNAFRTDSGSRDNYIKRTTLEVEKFPNASFVPTKMEGLPSPLPAAGTASFQLSGTTTIHGVQRELTWTVTATRTGNIITGKASTTAKFADFGLTIPKVAAVLSVKDEIRMEIDLTGVAS